MSWCHDVLQQAVVLSRGFFLTAESGASLSKSIRRISVPPWWWREVLDLDLDLDRKPPPPLFGEAPRFSLTGAFGV